MCQICRTGLQLAVFCGKVDRLELEQIEGRCYGADPGVEVRVDLSRG